MKTRHYRELLVWQEAMKLAQDVYKSVQGFTKEELFGLASQLRRAAVSVPSNIAEGHGRTSDKSFALFLGQARGSLYELETQIELAQKLGYIPEQDLQQLLSEAPKSVVCSMVCSGLFKQPTAVDCFLRLPNSDCPLR